MRVRRCSKLSVRAQRSRLSLINVISCNPHPEECNSGQSCTCRSDSLSTSHRVGPSREEQPGCGLRGNASSGASDISQSRSLNDDSFLIIMKIRAKQIKSGKVSVRHGAPPDSEPADLRPSHGCHGLITVNPWLSEISMDITTS